MLFDPHRRWAPRGICRWEDRELFFADTSQYQSNRRPGATITARWEEAKDICRMCPVLAECQRDTLGEPYGVFGARDQFERHLIRRALPRAVKGWPRERQQAWGGHLQTMREAGVSWGVIQLQTGLSQSAADWLIWRWEEFVKTQPKATTATVVDLPLPEPGAGLLPPFPQTMGRRHAWIRHRGLISDGWYRGETADGKWFLITTQAGRGQVHKWAATEDVHMYRPQAAVIMNYAGRPDDREINLIA